MCECFPSMTFILKHKHKYKSTHEKNNQTNKQAYRRENNSTDTAHQMLSYQMREATETIKINCSTESLLLFISPRYTITEYFVEVRNQSSFHFGEHETDSANEHSDRIRSMTEREREKNGKIYGR